MGKADASEKCLGAAALPEAATKGVGCARVLLVGERRELRSGAPCSKSARGSRESAGGS